MQRETQGYQGESARLMRVERGRVMAQECGAGRRGQINGCPLVLQRQRHALFTLQACVSCSHRCKLPHVRVLYFKIESAFFICFILFIMKKSAKALFYSKGWYYLITCDTVQGDIFEQECHPCNPTR